MTDRYISIFADFRFKRVFGEEVNKELLIDFLNAMRGDGYTLARLIYRKQEAL